jgi:hypothetical protein
MQYNDSATEHLLNSSLEFFLSHSLAMEANAGTPANAETRFWTLTEELLTCIGGILALGMISHLVRKSVLLILYRFYYARRLGLIAAHDQVINESYTRVSLLDTDTIPSAIRIHGTPKHKWMLCRD